MHQATSTVPLNLGWDIGGAHLKVAIAEQGRLLGVRQYPCRLWLGLDELTNVLIAVRESLQRELPRCRHHAITMTGEMADNFSDRAQGVRKILQTFRRSWADAGIRVYAEGTWLSLAQAQRHTAEVASANWHSAAAWVARHYENALWVDVGSTTTDIVPIVDGRVLGAQGDARRLQCGELIYAGYTRTPLMALSAAAPVAGVWTPLMAELFANNADIFRILGELDEATDMHPACDGGEKTVEASHQRLARMVGCDAADLGAHHLENLARWFRAQLLRRLEENCRRAVLTHALPATVPVVGGGIGRRLLPEVALRLGCDYVPFEALLGKLMAPLANWAGHCAPCVALALFGWDNGDR